MKTGLLIGLEKEWYEFNGHNSTKRISKAEIIWLIAPWMWKKIPTRYLTSKKVICTIHHIDENKFDDQEKIISIYEIILLTNIIQFHLKHLIS